MHGGRPKIIKHTSAHALDGVIRGMTNVTTVVLNLGGIPPQGGKFASLGGENILSERFMFSIKAIDVIGFNGKTTKTRMNIKYKATIDQKCRGSLRSPSSFFTS